MNSIAGESASLIKLGNNVPIDANVIIHNVNNVESTKSHGCPERNDGVMYKSNNANGDRINVLTGNSKNKILSDSTVIKIDTRSDTRQNVIANTNTLDIRLVDKENNSNKVELCTLVSLERNDSSTDESQNKVNVPTPDGNKIFERFLKDLYEKKLDLHNRFSDKEIKDIRTAVIEKVNLIVNMIYKIDSRLKVNDVLLVGSAKEGTQIIRPCEYDIILILEALSKPGTVSMIPEEPDSDSREYMRVKLEDADVRSVFGEFCNNDCIKATRWLPWEHHGLRDLFATAVSQAVVLCSRSCVKMETGELKLKRSHPEMNGPASTLRLLWKRATTKPCITMEISIDLCSAVKLDFEEYCRLLPPSGKVVTNNQISRNSSEIILPSSDN